MSKLLDEAVDIGDLNQRNLWVIYGKSQSGKTKVLSTFPKPMLYLRVGDDGSNTISNVEGISAIAVRDIPHLRELALELRLDKKYASVGCDTFSLCVNEWVDANAVQKKKRMSQRMWGDLGTDINELIKLFWILAAKKIVVLTCHEIGDSFEGMENEITPDIRPNVSKAARTYLEAMANYGLHTTVLKKTGDDGKETFKYGCHLGANPYYWTKAQKPAEIKLPKLVINPTYDKITKLIQGERG
jgi:hypothetical protein